MSSLPKYEGFRNYPTWCVDIWLQNDEPSYRYWTSRAREILSQARKVVPGEGVHHKAKVALATEIQDAVEGDTLELNGMYADLLNFALCYVEWCEVAEQFIDSE